MNTAIGYVRVSTDQQANEGVSLEAQAAKLTAWSTLEGTDLAATYVDALSGKRADNRPELCKALDHVCRVKGTLVVYSLSRLARSTKDTLAIAERLQKAGANLVSLSEKIDTTSAAGKMVFRLLAVLAEFERDQVAERTTAALRYKINNGERVGKVRFGYDLAANGVTLTANEAEQNVLAIINELREAGESMRQIAAELTRRGILTKEGNTTWSHSSVQRILKRAA